MATPIQVAEVSADSGLRGATNRYTTERKTMKSLGCLVLAVALISLVYNGCYAEEQEKSFKEAENLLRDGDSLLAKGSYDDAREKFKKILKKFPDFHKDSTRVRIARSYLEQENKDYAQAYILFDQLATHLSNFQEEAMYKTAYCLKELGRYEEALALYMDLRTRPPKSKYVPDAYFDIGEIYSESASYDLALASYDLALKSADDHNPYHSKAKIHNAIGRAHYNQGNFESNQGNFEKARAAYEKARAAFNLLLKKYKESEEVINASYMIAHIYGKEEKWDEAIDKYSSIIDEEIDGYIDPIVIDGLSIKVNTIAFSHFEIGQAYEMKENFKEAYDAYTRIVEEPKKGKDLRADPIAPFALYHVMDLLNKLWDEEKPRSDVKEELWSDPREEFNLADKYISYISDHSGKPFLAAEAQLQFARIQRKRKRYSKAAKEYAKLQDYKPSYTRLNLIKLRGKYYEGFCYENNKNNPKWKEDSEEAYEKVTMLFELNFQPLIDFPNIDIDFPGIDVGNRDYYISTALLYVGRANEKLRKLKKAEEAFKRLVTRYPKSEYVEEANKKIKGLRQERGDKTDSSDASGFYDQSEKSQTQQLTAQAVAEMAKGSTVFIETKKSAGSGFFVKPGQIATNFHVIEDAVEATARLVGTEKKYAIIGYTALDADRDLAILKVRAFGVKPLKLGDSDHVEQGTEAYPIGNPLGLVNVASDGKISSIQWVESIRRFFNNRSKISDRQQNDMRQKLLVMTAPISPGNSGGPVINGKGEVIGVSVGVLRGQNLNLAVPVNDLKALLEMVGPPKPLSDLEPIY